MATPPSSELTTRPNRYYPIGQPGQPWTKQEDDEWKRTVPQRTRSYQDQVVTSLQNFAQAHADSVLVEDYGSLSSHNPPYPLMAVRSQKDWNPTLPNVLITGGVHGYETSGVQGALLFLSTKVLDYDAHVNWVVVPCVSPWSYEHEQRWQADLLDPNRSFLPHDATQQTPESKALMDYLVHHLPASTNNNKKIFWTCHLDLHETTDTDATEFRPAKFAKAGAESYPGDAIPDGFYVVGNQDDTTNKKKKNAPDTMEFLSAIRDGVRTVTHIAPTMADGTLVLGLTAVAPGICLLPKASLGLCGGVTNAPYVATTEVYPDSTTAAVTPELCNQAQVAAVTAALDYILQKQQQNQQPQQE